MNSITKSISYLLLLPFPMMPAVAGKIELKSARTKHCGGIGAGVGCGIPIRPSWNWVK
jgi:hypothetical protein